jgi:hypothetical protein
VNSRAAGGILLLILLYSSCLSAPRKDVPRWVGAPPDSSAGELYFVGSGFDRTGSVESARLKAARDLVDQVTGRLELGDAAGSAVAVSAALASFQAELWESIVAEGMNPRATLRIVDTYSAVRSDGRSEYHILAACDEARLEGDKRRFSRLLRSPDERVAFAEEDGDRLSAAGRPFLAARTYLDAALVSQRSGVSADTETARRLLEKAGGELGKIRIRPSGSAVEGIIGMPYTAPFEARVVSPAGGGLPDTDILVSYEYLNSEGKLATVFESVKADSGGFVRFTPPAPRSRGNRILSFSLDLGAYLSALEGSSPELAPSIALLAAEIGRTRAVFPYSVISPARRSSSGILTVDLDSSGHSTGSGNSSLGILDVLSAAGFTVEILENDESFIEGAAADVALRAGEEYGYRYQRLIIGRSRIVDFSEKEGKYLVTVSGTVSVVEVPSGKELYRSGELSKSILGNNSRSAITSAFRQLGKVMGTELVDHLP